MENENKEISIEQSFEQLETIVDKMQTDELSLEETFALYKKGLSLVENCNKKIDKIQCDIHKITAGDE